MKNLKLEHKRLNQEHIKEREQNKKLIRCRTTSELKIHYNNDSDTSSNSFSDDIDFISSSKQNENELN